MMKKRFYIQGMHCASCEVLIEKTLIEKKGVRRVEASLVGGTLDIAYDAQIIKIDCGFLNQMFKDLGYTFSDKRLEKNSGRKKTPPLLYGGIFLSILVLFAVFDRLRVGQFVSIDATSSLPAFFLFGVAAGLSSCAALIGGVVLSLTKKWNEQYITASSMQKMRPHAAFHIGRVAAYVLGGGVLGTIGNVVTFENVTVYAVLIIVISVIMVVLGLQMLGISWVQNIRIAMPKFLSRISAGKGDGNKAPFLLGAATFFLPCGFTLATQGIALVSGSFVSGALIMGMFALGTLPILLGISMSGVYLNSKPHLTARFNVVAGMLILFFGLYNINAQMNVLGLPSVGAKASVEQVDISENISKKENAPSKKSDTQEQKLEVVAKGFEYIPKSLPVLKAGVPTILIVDDQGIQGCGRYMAARGLFPGRLDLEPGKNTIEFTPKKGTYKLTCTMGMVPPIIIKVE